MTFKKTKIALGIASATLAVAGVTAAPQALAEETTNAERVAEAASKKAAALEAQVNQMAAMMQAMQAELSRVKSASASVDKVQELDEWMASVKSGGGLAARDHQFSVRGGYMNLDDNRGSTKDFLGGAVGGYGNDLLTSEVDDNAFYYGGAIDFNVNNDLFGLMDDVSFQLELGLEYAELGEKETNGLNTAISTIVGVAGAPGAVPAGAQQSVTVNQLRISAAPKIKFMHGSSFRPWIVPIGLDINIISPPSDAVTVLNTGMQFGAGADYEIFNGIVAGVDGRYHWSPDDIDGVDTDGFTLGGSVGFKF